MGLDKKGSILIICLWILLILGICVLALAHRVSLATQISKYQINSLKAYALAKAGMNRMIVELEKDTNEIDYLEESWAKTSPAFKDFLLQDGKFSVSSIDEERKINLNYANKYLFYVLEIDPNIVSKYKNFSNMQMLKLIVSGLIYDKIKDIVTVYTSGKININTVSQETLEILLKAILEELKSSGQDTSDVSFSDLANKIIDIRNKEKFFKDTDSFLKNLDLNSHQINILNILLTKITFKSNIFHIISKGEILNSKIKKKIEIIFDRNNKKILYYYES